jgi:hypothetical protein
MKEALSDFANMPFIKEYEPLMKKDTWEFDEMSEIIRDLSKNLHHHFNALVLVLLGEYDSPLNNAYLEVFLDDALKLMRAFFSSTFKENRYLYKGIITGINRIARENLHNL